MQLIHVELAEANEFVAAHHRHHKPVQGHRFSIGAAKHGKLIGVCIVGRPVARKTDQKYTLEITRLCTDGTKNACSFLYSAVARAGRNLGYKKIQTFILETEPGVSLVSSGWKLDGTAGGGDWNVPSRGGRRVDQPMCLKQRWAKDL